MKRRILLPALAFIPVLYPLNALATQTLEPRMALQFLGLGLFAGTASVVGPQVSTRIRLFRGSQFWASETGLFIVLFGFLGPLFALMPGNPLFDALSEHLTMLALLTLSCLAGVGAIVEDGIQRSQRSRVRR